MSELLNVWYRDKKVGILTPALQGQVIFQYTTEWITSPNSFGISLSLPLVPSPFPVDISTYFFDNYLPEEYVRKLVASTYNINPSSTYDLLKVLGTDCAGALSILPVEEHLSNPIKNSYKELDYEELTNYIANIPKSPFGGNQNNVRLSLAGAQAKGVLYVASDGKFFLPQNGAPSTHILKVNNPRFEYLCENELFCMGLAQHIGLNIPKCFLSETMPKSFIISRYDRYLDSNGIVRIHQEDFCQALGLPSMYKYQFSANGVKLSNCFSLLSKCKNPIDDTKKLLQWVVYNVCIDNSDAHAKNLSLLYTDTKPSLAPFYDLVSTAPYDVKPELAMKIGGRKDADRLYTSQWKKFAKEINIDYNLVIDIGLSTVTKLINDIDEITYNFISQYYYFRGLDSIVDTIKRRANFLKKQFI